MKTWKHRGIISLLTAGTATAVTVNVTQLQANPEPSGLCFGNMPAGTYSATGTPTLAATLGPSPWTGSVTLGCTGQYYSVTIGPEQGAPYFATTKSAIFMIKYEDGTKDVFGSAQERTTTSRPQQQQQASRPATQQTSRSRNPVARETTARETAAAGFKSLEFYFKNNPKISIRTINN